MDAEKLRELKRNSARIRAAALRTFRCKKGGHVGGSLSIVELLSVLYTRYMHFDPANPQMAERDYLVLSKGHAGPALYAALSVFGFFPEEELATLNEGGTRFPSHPDRTRTPGVDVTTGSLAQGLSLAAGLGLALRMEGSGRYVYAIAGDGELNEGQCWEAFQFLAHYRLDHVLVFIDANKRQLDGATRDIMNPFDLGRKMEAFGFAVQSADGADEEAICDAIDRARSIRGRAVCVILDTTKGQGVPYFEEMADNHSVKFKERDIAEVDRALEQLRALCEGEQ